MLVAFIRGIFLCEQLINNTVYFFCHRPAAEWYAVGTSGNDIYKRM